MFRETEKGKKNKKTKTNPKSQTWRMSLNILNANAHDNAIRGGVNKLFSFLFLFSFVFFWIGYQESLFCLKRMWKLSFNFFVFLN